MSTLLAPSDPYSILHACIWDRPERESIFIKQEFIDAPAHNDLAFIQQSTYTVLDFGSNLCVFPDDRFKMMIREEYSSLWACIEKERHTPGRQFGGTVVTGHPGIGKSFFTYYYLVKSLLAGRPIALQTDRSSFFLFTDQGVYLVRFSSNTPVHDTQSHLKTLGCKKGVVALVDASEKNPSPATVFTDSRFPFYVVHATSPRSSRWKDWAEQRSAKIVAMKPWSWSEVFIGGMKFTERHISVQDLFDTFNRYGPNPRVCFDISGDEERIAVYEHTLRRDIERCGSCVEAIRDYGSLETPPNSSIFLMVPDSSRVPSVTFPSRYVCLLAVRNKALNEIQNLYARLDGKAETRAGANYLYEYAAYLRLGTWGFYGGLPYSPLLSYPNGDLCSPQSSAIRYLSIATLQLPVEREYCVFHDEKHDRSFNAFVLYNSSGAQRVDLLKTCSDLDSPIRVADLDELADRLPEELVPCADRVVQWNLVFVIPTPLKQNFQAQPYHGVSKRKWETEGYVCQYVVTLDI